MLPMARLNYKNLWDKLIYDLCAELVNIEKLEEKKTLEDEWIKGTLVAILKKMCALHKVPPKMQKSKLTRSLFEAD